MKKTNIKISKVFALAIILSVFFVSNKTVNANLDKNFRENFAEFTQKQCFNSIRYTVDDIVGFAKNEDNQWECHKGKCQEYQNAINCLFDDALEQGINKVNKEIYNYTGDKFAELKNTKIVDKQSCREITLAKIQSDQESLKFQSDCSGDFLSQEYSACRVTETILNELCGYQNFLAAKASDRISFSHEQGGDIGSQISRDSEFRALQSQYLKESSKSQKSFLEGVKLYKNFIHNYRVHAWLIAIKGKLKEITGQWQKIHNAIETFPSKFIDASSVN